MMKKKILIKISGKVAESAASLRAVGLQVKTLQDLGFQIAIVHGGGKQINQLAERLGVAQKIVAGRRLTDAETLDLVKMTLGGAVNAELVAALQASGISAVGINGYSGHLIHARKRPLVMVSDEQAAQVQPVDFGFVGDIVSIDIKLLTTLLTGGFVPVISPLSADHQGQILNLNADTVAAELAVAWGAERLIFLTDVAGVYTDVDDPASIQARLTPEGVLRLLESGAVSGGMIPKLKVCLGALAKSPLTIHMTNGLTPSSLVEFVRNQPAVGTSISH